VIIFGHLGEDGQAVRGDTLGHVIRVQQRWNAKRLFRNSKRDRIIPEKNLQNININIFFEM
jgi:hypothetical protein